MVRPDRLPFPDKQPPGVDGEGLDPYPTYRDGPTTPHTVTDTRPTDVGLQPSLRSSGMPMLVGLLAFAVIVIGLIVWASVRTENMSDEGLTPPESPPAAEAAGTPDEGQIRDSQPASEAGPGAIDEAPAPADVPGGETTTPVDPAPAQ